MGALDNYKVIWQPNPGPQTALVTCPVFEVFFGGARGGGKTEGSIGDWLEHANSYGEHANGIFLRRTAKQLEEVVARSQQIFTHLGARFRENKSEWKFPNGARLKFRYLERDVDAEEYQGHSYTRVYVEETTNFPSPDPIDKMRATLRSPVGVPVGMRLTGNPGGPGHQWVKARYITPHSGGYKIIKEPFYNPFTKETILLERVFIPSKISDNPKLMQNDPMYVARLQQQGSKQLVKAWLDGDWDIVIGAFFDCFDPARHILDASWLAMIPRTAMRFRAFDWGSAKPFCVGWYALSDGTWELPKGALVKYREWYGWTGKPNEGLKLDAGPVATGILERERANQEIIKYGVADPSIFVRDGGPSIAETMMVKGCMFRKGDRKRVTGWDQLRKYLIGEGGVPMLYFLETCTETLRTLPTLSHDEHNSEDIDTDEEDHAGDETRYAVMSRPYIPRVSFLPQGPEFKGPREVTMAELTKQHFARMSARREAMN